MLRASRRKDSGMSAPTYLNAAKKAFLNNTPYNSPQEAIEHGHYSIQDWCDCVEAHRRKYGITNQGGNKKND
jgi:hypothetical protein